MSSSVKNCKCLFLSSCQAHGRFHSSLFAASNSSCFPFYFPTTAAEGPAIGIGVRCDSVEGGLHWRLRQDEPGRVERAASGFRRSPSDALRLAAPRSVWFGSRLGSEPPLPLEFCLGCCSSTARSSLADGFLRKKIKKKERNLSSKSSLNKQASLLSGLFRLEMNRSAWTLLDEGFPPIQQPATLISDVVIIQC